MVLRRLRDVLTQGYDATFGSLEAGEVSYPPGGAIKEVDNSPLKTSPAQSHTFNLSEDFDKVIFDIKGIENVSGSRQDISMRVNGVSSGSNYFYRDNADNETQSENEWLLGNVSNNQIIFGEVSIQGVGSNIGFKPDIGSSTGNTVTEWGILLSNSGPIDSVTIFGGLGDIIVNARVYGKTV